MNEYKICVAFHIKSEDDDEALHKLTRTLVNNTPYNWSWVYTKLEGENNDASLS